MQLFSLLEKPILAGALLALAMHRTSVEFSGLTWVVWKTSHPKSLRPPRSSTSTASTTIGIRHQQSQVICKGLTIRCRRDGPDGARPELNYGTSHSQSYGVTRTACLSAHHHLIFFPVELRSKTA